MFPKVHKFLSNEFYYGFDRFPEYKKARYSLWLFTLVTLILTFLITGGVKANDCDTRIRGELIETLKTQLEVREATNNNDGAEVEEYLSSVGLGKGYPWCAAYVSYNLDQVNVPNPMTAWSPSFAAKNDIVWQPKKGGKWKPGDVFTLYYPNLGRVGHVGFVVGKSAGYLVTIEGNSNNTGGRLGTGVFKLKRNPAKVYAITNYITPYAKNLTNHPACCLSCRVSEKVNRSTNQIREFGGNQHKYQRAATRHASESSRERDRNNWSARWFGFNWTTLYRSDNDFRWSEYAQYANKGWEALWKMYLRYSFNSSSSEGYLQRDNYCQKNGEQPTNYRNHNQVQNTQMGYLVYGSGNCGVADHFNKPVFKI